MKLEVLSRTAQGAARKTPLLFVHGAWHGAWCWDVHFLDYFAARGWNCHAVSLRGHGASEGHAQIRRHRMADYVKDVAEIADSLPHRPAVIGHSMGGAVTQKYLEHYQAPAAGLMASMPPSGVLLTVARLIRRYPMSFVRMNLTLSLLPMIETAEMTRLWFFSNALPQGKLDEYHARMQNESYAAFMDMLAFDLPQPKRALKTPMWIAGAEHDTVFSTDQVHSTAAAFGTTATVFPDMAHDMMLEPGWERVAKHLHEWLTRQLP